MSRGNAGLRQQQPRQQSSGVFGSQEDEESEAEPPDLSPRAPLQSPVTHTGAPLGSSRLRSVGVGIGVDARTSGVGSHSSSRSSREIGRSGREIDREREIGVQEQPRQPARRETDSNESRRQGRQSRRPASCTNCRARKVRCDKVIPCSQCFLRGISHTCAVPSSTGASPSQTRRSSGIAGTEPLRQQGDAALQRTLAPSGRSSTSASIHSVTSVQPLPHPRLSIPPSRQGPATGPSRTSVEQHLITLERKVDRLTTLVERLVRGGLTLAPASRQPARSSFTNNEEHSVANTALPRQVPSSSDTNVLQSPDRNASEQLHLRAVQQQQQQQQFFWEEQMRQGQASTLSSALQSLSATGNVTLPMFLPAHLTTDSSLDLHSAGLPPRGSQQPPSPLYPSTGQDRQPVDLPLFTDANAARVNLAETGSEVRSLFTRTPDNETWSYTSTLASLSLGEGDDAILQETPTSSSPN